MYKLYMYLQVCMSLCCRGNFKMHSSVRFIRYAHFVFRFILSHVIKMAIVFALGFACVWCVSTNLRLWNSIRSMSLEVQYDTVTVTVAECSALYIMLYPPRVFVCALDNPNAINRTQDMAKAYSRYTTNPDAFKSKRKPTKMMYIYYIRFSGYAFVQSQCFNVCMEVSEWASELRMHT